MDKNKPKAPKKIAYFLWGVLVVLILLALLEPVFPDLPLYKDIITITVTINI